MIYAFSGATPRYDATNFIAPSADVIGHVELGTETSIWFHATVRGDVNRITIGPYSNIQDNAVVHVTRGTAPTHIGAYVTVGHGAIIHGCTIEDEVLIGMGAVILDHAHIGTQSIIGARTLVTARTEIPPRSLVLGTPARVIRTLTDEEIARIRQYAENYRQYSRIYRGEAQTL